MDYSKNHARNLSNLREHFGDEAVYVTCMICQSRQPADGRHAMRAHAERGVKSRAGYTGPAQVWLCSMCVSDFGMVVTREMAEELWPPPAHVTDHQEQQAVLSDRESWPWLLAAGVAVVAAGVTWWVFGGDE
jgi:hypothetical protein